MPAVGVCVTGLCGYFHDSAVGGDDGAVRGGRPCGLSTLEVGVRAALLS